MIEEGDNFRVRLSISIFNVVVKEVGIYQASVTPLGGMRAFHKETWLNSINTI